MIFYLVVGGLFAVYGIDLLLLVIISLVARAAEVRALLARSKEHKAAQARRKRVKKHETKHCKHGQGHQPAVPGKPMGAGTGSNSSKSAAAALQAGAIAGAKPLQIPHVVMVEDGDGSRGSETGEVTPAVPSGTSSGCPATPSTPTAGAEAEPMVGVRRLAHVASDVAMEMSTLRSVTSHTDDSLLTGSSSIHGKSNLSIRGGGEEGPSHRRATSVGAPSIATASTSSSSASKISRQASPVPLATEPQASAKSAPDGLTLHGSEIEGLVPVTLVHPSGSVTLPMPPDLTAAGGRGDVVVPAGLTPTLSSASALSTDTRSSYLPPSALKPSPSLVPNRAWRGPSGISLGSSGGSGLLYDLAIAAEALHQQPGGDGDADGKMAALQRLKDKLPKNDFSQDLMVCEEEGGDLPEGAWPRPITEYPMVLVQLPMFNEEAHAALIVERCCEIAWPRSRLLIQVLDDSTKAHVREKVDAAAAACMELGHPVQVLRRDNRSGYKAGAMVEGLKHISGVGFKYVAIFDADFEPPRDFLLETIGPLEADPKLGFVQTRWLCPANSFLTWAQRVNLGFHFDVEQRARSFMGWFFNFNGTAGVWRIETIDDAGGWQSDTVVEDMDLSLRAHLKGWGAVYLPHVGCSNEVPDRLSTYKTQQYRWLCGPMQILSKAFWHIWCASHVPAWRRMICYWFFGRYVLFAIITLAVLAVPPVALWIDPWHWKWPEIFFAACINFAACVYLYITPWSPFYLLFSVATGYFKAWAMLGGLCGSKKSKSWKVTAKKGTTPAAPGAAPATAPGAAGSAPAGAAAVQGPASGAAAVAQPEAQARCSCFWAFWEDLKERFRKPYALETCLCAYYTALAVLAGLGFHLDGPSILMCAYCALMALIFLVMAFGDIFL